MELMTTEAALLLSLAAACAVLIGVVGRMRAARQALWHAIALVCYSVPLWYAILYKGGGGAGLTWLFYLFLAYALHIIVLLAAVRRSAKSTKVSRRVKILALAAVVLLVIFCILVTG